MDVRELLITGNFNDMYQETQSDGARLVILTRRGDPHRYMMKVRNLYQPDEVVEWQKTEEV